MTTHKAHIAEHESPVFRYRSFGGHMNFYGPLCFLRYVVLCCCCVKKMQRYKMGVRFACLIGKIIRQIFWFTGIAFKNLLDLEFNNAVQ